MGQKGSKSGMSNMVGGMQGVKAASADGQKAADAVKAQVEEKLGKSLSTYKVTHEATQVVAGTNWFLKVDTGDKHVHLRVWEKLGSDGHELSGIQDNKSANDALEYFDA